MKLKNISVHRPENMIIEVGEEDVKTIVKTGDFIELNDKKPDDSWTEKEIDKWVENNAPDIKYYPTKHTKKYILDKLREENLI